MSGQLHVRVTAVIPVHNRADLLAHLLETVRQQTRPFDEVIVTDNASTDGAAELAAAAGCRVIPMGENSGFARAVNRGWREAQQDTQADWIAILNSDVELGPAWLERLLAAAGSASFATGKILDVKHPDRIDATYDLIARSGCAWRAGNGALDSASTEPRPISIAPATACLFRRSVLEQMQGFDETFESYLEDVDLGLRCVEGGFSGVYIPTALARHHGSATLGRWNTRVIRLISRNQLRLITRHYDAALFRDCLWPILAGQLLWGLVAIRHGAGRAWLRGKIDGLRGWHLSGKPSSSLRRFLAESEREIEERATDPYWRLYFQLAARREPTRELRRNDT